MAVAGTAAATVGAGEVAEEARPLDWPLAKQKKRRRRKKRMLDCVD